jgi:DNA-binding transcriptional ArsR family regulator
MDEWKQVVKQAGRTRPEPGTPPTDWDSLPAARAAIEALKPYLRAIGDPKRIFILHELAQTGERTVLELAALLGLSQPLTSWHLLILKRARLVAPTRRGRQVLYRLDNDRLREWRTQFDALMNL